VEYYQIIEAEVEKPIVIAAMQDMGNVGSIVVNFINHGLKSKKFRVAKSQYPTYVVDTGGHIDLPEESWEYRYCEGLIIFGGGTGQPQDNQELYSLCQDVLDISKKYSAKFIYTFGGFHTNRVLDHNPKTFVTTTSMELTKQMKELGILLTPQRSIITGFNGLILAFAKQNGIQGIGMYGELNHPEIPQYRAAISIIKTLEKLTYRKLGDISYLESKALEIEKNFEN